MSKTTSKNSPEVRARSVRMVLDGGGQHESRWAANRIDFIEDWLRAGNAERMGQEVEVDTGQCGRVTSEQVERMKTPERKLRELKQANEILRNGNIPPEDAEANFCAAHERCKRWGGRPPGGIKCAKVVGVETFYEESVHERG